MKRMVITGIVALTSMVGGALFAAEAKITADFVSAYVFRGATLNDGTVFQPGLSVSSMAGESVPFSVGVWGNLDIDDYDGTLDDGQFSELDLYATVAVPMPEEADYIGLEAGYTEYTYPGGDAEADRELSLAIDFDVPSKPKLAAYYGVDGGIDKNLYLELGVSHEMTLTDSDIGISFGADLGYADPDVGESGFSHYNLDLGLSYKIFVASVTYVGQIDDDVLPDVEDGGSYDTDVYGTLGIVYGF